VRLGCDNQLLLRRWRRSGYAGHVRSGAASLAVSITTGPRSKYFVCGRAPGMVGGRAFPSCAELFLCNSHQNSHSPKIKMAADLAASHIIDFIAFLAPQVGLEPTTLRLTAGCSAIFPKFPSLFLVFLASHPTVVTSRLTWGCLITRSTALAPRSVMSKTWLSKSQSIQRSAPNSPRRVPNPASRNTRS
jgi:hypothetical protein